MNGRPREGVLVLGRFRCGIECVFLFEGGIGEFERSPAAANSKIENGKLLMVLWFFCLFVQSSCRRIVVVVNFSILETFCLV